MGRKSDYGNGMYQQLQEIMGRLETVEKDSKQKIETLNKRIDTLEKENQNLKKENQLLRDDNARLRSIINNDSSNTSLPPSTDQKGSRPANTFNGREKTRRRAGGQKGHAGTTLTKSLVEEKIRSGSCRHEIQNIGDTSGQKYITKYVMAVSLYSEGVMSNDRIAAFLNSISNEELCLSEGSVYGFCKKFAENSKKSIRNLETALYHFGTDHGECNVHLLRYLCKNTEYTGHEWSREMTGLLCGMNKERKEFIAQGKRSFPEETITAYEQKYHDLIAKGREENKTTAHKYAREDEMTLLNRIEKYSHNHLLFLHDFSVFFDDNMSERDLRKAKSTAPS